MNIQVQTALACRLTFRHMHNEGRALSFPCDLDGQVLLDELSERARTNYFYARTTVGREFLSPILEHTTDGSETLQPGLHFTHYANAAPRHRHLKALVGVGRQTVEPL